MNNQLRVIYVIWLREILKFWREKTRIITSLVQPAVWLFIMGKGLGASFAGPMGIDYATFMFPGIVGMTVLFTAIFSAVSIVWDREFGFLKEMLVAPVSRASIVVGKAFSGSTVAVIQGALVLLFAPLVGITPGFMVIMKALVVMFIISFALSSLGIVAAAKINSMQSFQLLMNLLIMPMFFLSGAIFPLTGLPLWLKSLTVINPLSYGVDALKGVLLNTQTHSLLLDIGVMLLMVVVLQTAAVVLFAREG